MHIPLSSPAVLAIGVVSAAIFGETISQDTPITIQAASITGCVVVSVALWISNRFSKNEKDISEIKKDVGDLKKDTAYFHKQIHDKLVEALAEKK